jgi:hypothetical protein
MSAPVPRDRALAVAALAAACLWSAGCSFYYSSRSISDSVESSSRSSSSSSPGSNESAYREDVSDYVLAYVTSGGSESGLMSGIGDLAAKRAISDWESEPYTWEGIGRGLGRTRISEVELDVYKKNWSGGDPVRMAGIQKGFEDAR